MSRSFVLLMFMVLVGCTDPTHPPDLRAGDSGATRNDAAELVDPLVGMWTCSGDGPNLVALALTFGADKTIAIVAHVAPRTTPSSAITGLDAAISRAISTACKTVSGTYLESSSGGTKSLTWATSSGGDNAIVDCSGGNVVTDADVDALFLQGIFPPRTFNYEADSTMLILTFPYPPRTATASPGPGLSIPCSRSPS